MEGVESDGRGARAPVLNGAEREVALGTCHLRAAEAGPAGRGRGRACGRQKGTASRGESDDPGLRGRRSSRRSGRQRSRWHSSEVWQSTHFRDDLASVCCPYDIPEGIDHVSRFPAVGAPPSGETVGSGVGA